MLLNMARMSRGQLSGEMSNVHQQFGGRPQVALPCLAAGSEKLFDGKVGDVKGEGNVDVAVWSRGALCPAAK